MPTLEETAEQIAQWLRSSHTAVAFSGAGISTESGIPDFRSPGGVWSKSQPVMFDEFVSDPLARYEYWRQKSVSHDDFVRAAPNIAHQALARWQDLGLIHALITQNIDGLHEAAGSRHVWELHGTNRYVGCLDCSSRFDADPYVTRFRTEDRVPDCPRCGGMLKHATISFGQALNAEVLRGAIEAARRSDLFLCIGSSLVVTPAAELPAIAKRSGAKLIIINRDETPLDRIADAILRDPIGQVFETINHAITPSELNPEPSRRAGA